MKPEFTPKRSPLSRRKHALTFDERLWQRLGVVARKHYGGNHSRALEGLLLHDWLVETNKARDGKEHTHWISAPVVLNPGELEPLLDRLERGEADELGSYVDRLVEARLAQLNQPPPAAEPPSYS
jgi:hypothetical protein